METLLIMLKNVIIFVLLAVPGYLLVKGNILKPQESGGLSKLLTNVGMPALILSSTLDLELSGQLTVSLLVVAVICTAFTALCFLTSAWLFPGEKSPKTNGVMRFAAIFVNSGFIGIPLASAVFGSDSPAMAYLIVSNIIMNVLLFTLGVYLISGDRNAINIRKALLTPVLLAFMAGIVLNLLGVPKAVPELLTYSNHFKGIVTPLSMVVLGMKMAEVPLKKLFTSGKMYYVSALRLVVYPVLGMALVLALQPVLKLSTDAVLGFFVGVAMPTAGMATAFADQYGGDTENAVILTLGTTIVSVLTIPVLYWLLRMVV